MSYVSTRARSRKHFHANSTLEQLWANVCVAYSQSADYRAGNNSAYSKALRAFEAKFAPENLNSACTVVDFRQIRRSRR